MKKSERYILELKSGHEAIKGLFMFLKELVDAEGELDSGAVMQALTELKEVLIAHVKDENENFYPAIRQRAVELGRNASLPAIDLCSESMYLINREAGDFFGRFKTEQDLLTYGKDFKGKLDQLVEDIEERIKNEEECLFHLYREYFSSS